MNYGFIEGHCLILIYLFYAEQKKTRQELRNKSGLFLVNAFFPREIWKLSLFKLETFFNRFSVNF